MTHCTTSMRAKNHAAMDWKCNWTSFTGYMLPLLFYVIVSIQLVVPVRSENNACDWNGSGLSTMHDNREVESIYLRCSAGNIVWNYPRGAIRILLRKPIHLQKNFRACLKIYPPAYSVINSKTSRIFLEAPKRLIPLFDDDDNGVAVKCFRSINEQVVLYVEAAESPFANVQTVFKYNLEFINNKHYSIRYPTAMDNLSSTPTTMVQFTDDNKNSRLVGNDAVSNVIGTTNTDKTLGDGSWRLLWRRLWVTKEPHRKESSTATANGWQPERKGLAVDEQIIGTLGETFEICRPCTEMEMTHAYCSSDIVTRGTIFGIQAQPKLSTIEIYVNRTKVLRDNTNAILNAEDAWRHYNKKRSPTQANDADIFEPLAAADLSFHTPLHCETSHDDGEFVFMGRRRFEEMMIICSPRLDEWARIVNRLSDQDNAPCILKI